MFLLLVSRGFRGITLNRKLWSIYGILRVIDLFYIVHLVYSRLWACIILSGLSREYQPFRLLLLQILNMREKVVSLFHRLLSVYRG